MSVTPEEKQRSAQLHAAAETRTLGAQASTPADTASLEALVHSLQAHQIELEMQNKAQSEALRLSQAALTESRDRYTALHEFSPVGYLTLDADGLITDANLTAATMLDVERGKPEPQHFSRIVAAEDRERFHRLFMSAMRNGEWQVCEVTFQHVDGSRVHAQVNCRRIQTATGIPAAHMTLIDFTERHVAEREARKLLQAVEQSPVSIVITNREGLIEYVNPGFTRVSGYSREDVLGKNPRILQSGETPVETYRELWATLLAGKEWRGVVRNRRKNGELFWEEASISPIISERGEITHFLAVKEDVSERIRIHQELVSHQLHLDDMVRQRTADLEAALEAATLADRAKDQFLANVSHELRTPLNAVIGLSGLARSLSSDPRQQDYLDKVSNAGKTLSAIINDLLDLSKIAAGRLEFDKTTFSLRGLVARCNSVMSFRAAEKGLQLIEQIDPQVPDPLVGDSLRIEQILLNLLSNAVKFTAAGRVELRVGVQEQIAQRVCLAIEVADTGIGIREEDVDVLFKPFSQADATMTRKYGGTGLGLAICRLLAEMMEGGISVVSRVGQGSTFRVALWLPIGYSEDLPVAEPHPGREGLPVGYQDAHVLLVEDQPLNREIVEALLGQVGIVPAIATNGQEALDRLATSGGDAFDLVLMDIQMPVLDGLDATRELRRRPGFASLPVIAMTAHTMEHEKGISVAAGMNDHIGKPIDKDAFFRTLARWLPVAKRGGRAAPPATTGATQNAPAPVPPPIASLPVLNGIDVETAVGRFAGNTARYRHWLMVFAEEGNAAARQIRQALDAGQTDVACRAAHALKGRLGMLGMGLLHAMVTSLEAALRNGTPVSELLEDLEHFELAVEQTGEQIRMTLGGGQSPADRDDLPPVPIDSSIPIPEK
jgi:PAS domain S-box-containing protein